MRALVEKYCPKLVQAFQEKQKQPNLEIRVRALEEAMTDVIITQLSGESE